MRQPTVMLEELEKVQAEKKALEHLLDEAPKVWAEKISELERALRKIATTQPEALEMIRDKGFIFEDIGSEPGNWQHLAFTLYTEICEIDMIAREALGIGVGDPE